MSLRRLALGAILAWSPAVAEERSDCAAAPPPVVTLDFGSRYTAESETRSDFDEEGDRAVTAALKPIDDFVADLARQTDVLNDPKTEPTRARKVAACVQASILTWAKGKALSQLESQGANLSVPSRVGGIAFAYHAARRLLPEASGNAEIEKWLLERARQTMAFFDSKAPPRASENNLRAWAGLAVTRIGLTLDNSQLINWGEASARRVACTADRDGSLPNEMWRGKLALHYQLHAVAPLVTTAALLEDTRPGLFQACEGAILRVVDFTLAGLKEPSVVEELTGKGQTVGGSKKPRDFELAWLPTFLRFHSDPEAEALSRRVGAFGNSKLGGNQRLLWGVD
jgi:poly(beta-D-mannuronate) lyase